LVLSIDLELQKFALERLAGEQAAVVVMNIHTGEIHAMASTPSYDSNEFVGGMSPDVWRKLQRDPQKPLLNRAVRGQYPPGSTFKMVVALAALESGMVSPGNRVHCPGAFFLGRTRFRCWKRGGHGSMNMHDAIKRSCDVYFYTMARKIGVERIAAMSRKLGLGSVEGFDYGGAKPGLIPTPGWKQSTIGEPWYPGETVVAGIGQGYVLATPLQLAVYAARIASGHAVIPRLVRAVGAKSALAGKFDKLDIDAKHLDLIRKAMIAVVNERGGTAGRSKFDFNGLLMAGKTGTSQVVSLNKVRRRGGKIAREHMDHALFVAFTPTENPTYAAAVIVEHGGGGSRAAAPVAKDVLLKVLERDPANTPAFELKAPEEQTAQEAAGTRDG
ncbi:MAG: penicillin-binding protein 2, partial [Hyphomicrobiales bacterium]